MTPRQRRRAKADEAPRRFPFCGVQPLAGENRPAVSIGTDAFGPVVFYYCRPECPECHTRHQYHWERNTHDALT